MLIFEVKNARIIPTRVGRSFVKMSFSERDTDHPHACGEKFYPDFIGLN